MIATIVFPTASVVAETMSDCLSVRMDHRKTARTALDHDAAACSGDRQCVKDAQAKWNAAAKHIDDEASACKARVQSQTKAEPPPYLNWKPGDPSPQAKDGRRYIMSCSGKVLGMYKPGGAVEMELKTHLATVSRTTILGSVPSPAVRSVRPGKITATNAVPDHTKNTAAASQTGANDT